MLLLTFPLELLHAILLDLDPQDLIRCRQVCRMLKYLIDDSSDLNIILRLFAEGWIGSFTTRGAHQIFSQLMMKKQELFQWDLEAAFSLPASPSDCVYIQDGMVVQKSFPNHEETTLLFHCILATSGLVRSYSFNVDIPVQHVTWQESTDLLVLTQAVRGQWNTPRHGYYLHFRSLSTGKPHLQVSKDKIYVEEEIEGDSVDYSCRLFGDMVLIMVYCRASRFFRVWNWKNGDVVVEKTMAECVLLRPDFVLELHTPEDKERFMRVSYFSDDTELILQFPPGSNYYMTLWDEPPSFSTVRKVQDRLYRDPSIDVISLQVIFSNNLEDDFYIIISLCLLLQLIDKLARRGESQTFPWEEWGPNITRWIPSILFAPEPRAVSGSRICVTTDNLRFTHGSDILQDILPGDGYYCSVLDFNSRAVKQGLSLQDDTAFSCSLITDGWIFYHPDLSTKVMSSLPFRHFISKKPAMDNLPLEMEMWAVGDVAYMIQDRKLFSGVNFAVSCHTMSDYRNIASTNEEIPEEATTKFGKTDI